MHPIGLHRQGQIHPVIHDEQGAVGGAEIPQRHRFLVAVLTVSLLIVFVVRIACVYTEWLRQWKQG